MKHERSYVILAIMLGMLIALSANSLPGTTFAQDNLDDKADTPKKPDNVKKYDLAMEFTKNQLLNNKFMIEITSSEDESMSTQKFIGSSKIRISELNGKLPKKVKFEKISCKQETMYVWSEEDPHTSSNDYKIDWITYDMDENTLMTNPITCDDDYYGQIEEMMATGPLFGFVAPKEKVTVGQKWISKVLPMPLGMDEQISFKSGENYFILKAVNTKDDMDVASIAWIGKGSADIEEEGLTLQVNWKSDIEMDIKSKQPIKFTLLITLKVGAGEIPMEARLTMSRDFSEKKAATPKKEDPKQPDKPKTED